MPSSPAPSSTTTRVDRHPPSIAARITATILTVGALSMLASIMLPAFLALVLAIAMSPVANWLEGWKLPRTVASLLCLSAVVALLLAAIGLIVYPSSMMLQQADPALEKFGQFLDDFSRVTKSGPLLESLGLTGEESEGPPPAGEESSQAEDRGEDAGRDFWGKFMLQSGQSLGRWIARGIGGLLGVVGGLIILLAFFFYMLNDRSEWIGRIEQAARAVNMRFDDGHLDRVRGQMVTYVRCLALVSLSYAVLVTLATWAIGLPNPLFWGILAGFLEFIPYFGPFIAGALPTLVAATLGHGWWPPLLTAALFAAIETFEGYVVAPLLYGRAVSIDPVTILFGVLFMGWAWGPLGLMAAMPMLILIRGVLSATPGTPALDALADVEET